LQETVSFIEKDVQSCFGKFYPKLLFFSCTFSGEKLQTTALGLALASSIQNYCSLAVLLVGKTANYYIRKRKQLQGFSK